MVQWGQIFNIYMIYWPESIKLQLFEYCDSNRVIKPKELLISEIILPIPDTNCTCRNYSLEKYEFSSKDEYYNTQSGVLYANASWGVDEKTGNILIPSNMKNKNYIIKSLQSYDAITALGVSRMQDINELAKWIFKSNLDPNDPRNSDLINLITVKLLIV